MFTVKVAMSIRILSIPLAIASILSVSLLLSSCASRQASKPPTPEASPSPVQPVITALMTPRKLLENEQDQLYMTYGVDQVMVFPDGRIRFKWVFDNTGDNPIQLRNIKSLDVNGQRCQFMGTWDTTPTEGYLPRMVPPGVENLTYIAMEFQLPERVKPTEINNLMATIGIEIPSVGPDVSLTYAINLSPVQPSPPPQ